MSNKPNQAKLNRVLYVTMIMILCIMAVVVAVTSSLNRAKKENESLTPPTSTNSSNLPSGTQKPSSNTSSPITKSTPPETTTPNTDKVPDTDSSEKSKDAVLPKATLPDFSLPVKGDIVKSHDDSSPVYSNTMDDYRVHLGVDIASTVGTPVCASADGTISQIWEDPLMGTCISIAHTGGAVTTYKNLAPEFDDEFAVGDNISRGQVIGTVGESALVEIADEPHLHFEMTVNGALVNPTDYLPIDENSATSVQPLYED